MRLAPGCMWRQALAAWKHGAWSLLRSSLQLSPLGSHYITPEGVTRSDIKDHAHVISSPVFPRQPICALFPPSIAPTYNSLVPCNYRQDALIQLQQPNGGTWGCPLAPTWILLSRHRGSCQKKIQAVCRAVVLAHLLKCQVCAGMGIKLPLVGFLPPKNTDSTGELGTWTS